MTKEVEDIIKTKAFSELTSEEKTAVQEWAQNEEEYANMKWFLLGSVTAFGAHKIQASPELKKGVMEHLTESKKKKGFWLNSVGVFLMPEGKKFYQKPAFQMSVAAALVLGVLLFFDRGIQEESLALNETVIEVDSDEVPVFDQIESEQDALVEKDLDHNKQEETVELIPAAPPIVLDDKTELSADLMTLEDEAEVNVLPEPVVEEVVEMEESYNEGMDIVNVEDFEEEVAKEEYKMDKDQVVSPGNSFDAEATDVLERRDRRKNKAFRSEKKGAENQREDLSSTAPAADLDDSTIGGYASAETASGTVSTGKEIINPKALHINQTKELNALFHIEK